MGEGCGVSEAAICPAGGVAASCQALSEGVGKVCEPPAGSRPPGWMYEDAVPPKPSALKTDSVTEMEVTAQVQSATTPTSAMMALIRARYFGFISQVSRSRVSTDSIRRWVCACHAGLTWGMRPPVDGGARMGGAGSFAGEGPLGGTPH